MATLGQSSGTGFTFTVSTWGDMAGGAFTMPAGGGVVTDINAFAGNNGTGQSARLYVWQDSGGIPGAWLVRGSATFALGGLGWQTQSTLASGAGITGQYIPGGTVIWIGIYCAGSTEQVGANAGSGGGTEIGNTSDGNWSDHGAAGLGQMGAYITYTPGGVLRVNTGTPGSPNWVVNAVRINTGTPGSPVWTNCRWRVNTGTPGSPNWVDCT